MRTVFANYDEYHANNTLNTNPNTNYKRRHVIRGNVAVTYYKILKTCNCPRIIKKYYYLLFKKGVMSAISPSGLQNHWPDIGNSMIPPVHCPAQSARYVTKIRTS
jgi:hypothetical protein